MQTNPTLDRLKTALADRYAVEREIAAGGMATVYLAEDLRHSRKVAIKVLDPELAAAIGAERFLREIGVAANLVHPHILPLFDSGEADGFLYFVMPFVDGESLRERLGREKQLPVEDAIRIGREIAAALSYAHDEGVIHRDVKPANIMMKAGHAMLADFGVAHSVTEARDERLTRTGTSLGTPAYMSPEQCTGDQDLDGRSDQYALGCVLYEMLAGQPPFTGSAESLVRQHLVAEPRPISQMRGGIPEAVGAVLDRALAKTPADRFGSVGELGHALGQLDAARPTSEKNRPVGLRLALGVAAAAAVIWGGLALSRPDADLTPNSAWMLPAAFTGTAEPELLRAARDLVLTELQQSQTIGMLTQAEIARALELTGRPASTEIGPDLAVELAERGRIGAVLAGELDRVGNTYSVRLRILDVETAGRPLAVATESARDADQLITAVGDAARSIRSQLGEAQIDLAGDRRLKDLITPSLAAYRKYRAAFASPMSQRERISTLHEALALDTGFAMVMLSLPNYYANTGQYDSAIVYLDRALARPDRLTEAQMLIARAGRASARGNIPEAYRLQAEAADEHGDGFANVGAYLDRLGRFEEAADYFRNFDRPFGMNWAEESNQVWRLLRLREIEEADALWDEERDGPRLGWLRLIVREQWNEALALATNGANDVTIPPGSRARLMQARASLLAAMGAVTESWEVLGSAVALAPGYGEERMFEGSRMLLAVATESPTRPTSGTLDTDSSTAGLLYQSIAAAGQGDSLTARALVRRVEQQPPDTYAPYTTVFLMVEALLAKSDEEWHRIPELVAEAAPGHWPHFPRGQLHNFHLLQWMVGDAYERLEQPASAVPYFEMLTTSLWDYNRHGFAKGFAHRRLARLYEELGEQELAQQQWQQFLDVFTRPDPEFVWMVEEAREAVGGVWAGR